MADNIAVTPGSGATVRSIDKSSKLTQVVVLDLGGAGAESLATTTIPVTDSVASQTIKTVKVAYTASQTAATVLTPTAGKKYVITDYTISSSAAGTIYLFDNTDSATTGLTPTLSLAANSGVTKSRRALFTASAADNVLKYTSGSNAAGSILISYYEI
jgi:hypothetical protein